MPVTEPVKVRPAYDILTHLVLMPVFTIALVLAILHFRHPEEHNTAINLWIVVVVIGLMLLNMKTRLYSLRVQDRLIRLEERLRITTLLPHDKAAAAIQTLSTPQLIALRFAPDAEIPALVSRTLAESLDPKTIKSSIVSWRQDGARI